jgi:hypothetical protein
MISNGSYNTTKQKNSNTHFCVCHERHLPPNRGNYFTYAVILSDARYGTNICHRVPEFLQGRIKCWAVPKAKRSFSVLRGHISGTCCLQRRQIQDGGNGDLASIVKVANFRLLRMHINISTGRRLRMTLQCGKGISLGRPWRSFRFGYRMSKLSTILGFIARFNRYRSHRDRKTGCKCCCWFNWNIGW